MNRQPKIFIVDDDPATVRLFEHALQPLGVVVHSFESAEDFLYALRPTDFGCLLLDLGLPKMSGNELQRQLVETGADLSVIIVSGTADVPSVVQAFRAGAVDVIQKPFELATVRDAVRRALVTVRSNRTRRIHSRAARDRVERLSKREHEVAQLLIDGRANKQVAAELGLSVRTVEVHRAHIMKKLAVDSFAEALQIWLLADTRSTPQTTPQAR